MSILNRRTQLGKKEKKVEASDNFERRSILISNKIRNTNKASKALPDSVSNIGSPGTIKPPVNTVLPPTTVGLPRETPGLPPSLGSIDSGNTVKPIIPVVNPPSAPIITVLPEPIPTPVPAPITVAVAPSLYNILEEEDRVFIKWKGQIIPNQDRYGQPLSLYKLDIMVKYGENSSFSFLDSISIENTVNSTVPSLNQTFDFPVVNIVGGLYNNEDYVEDGYFTGPTTYIKLTMQITGSNGITSYDSNVVSYGQKNYWVNVALPLYVNETIVEENTDALRSFIGGTQRVYFPINYLNA